MVEEEDKLDGELFGQPDHLTARGMEPSRWRAAFSSGTCPTL
ncbi:hypothetical protein [Streptomyces sp. SID11385]|nr:hypothetical protein [Streptomyces sp. SID11385]